MKWRQSVIYLVVLVLVGGYFYYFEVVKKEQKEAAEKEAKKVFQLKVDGVQAIEIQSKDKQPVQLKKETEWKVVGPITTDADKPAVKSFLNTLDTLESQRDVVVSSEDLKPYGLQEPALKVRFQVGDQWNELLVGDKTPVGDGYYAKVGKDPKVFLIAAGSWGGLNKGLEELRKRELFSFQTDDVLGIEVRWQDGTMVRVNRPEGENAWKDPDQPAMKMKESKVRNVLEQIQWLRAQRFLDNDIKDLEPHGLASPYVTVKLNLKNDRNVELQLAAKSEGKKEVAALSSELPAVVEVASDILNDLPKDPRVLEDRSLVSLKKEAVTEIKWQVGDTKGDVVQTAKDKWGLKEGDGEPKPFKDSWHVSSLLWDLDETEYDKAVDQAPAMPGEPSGRLEVWSGPKRLVVLVWDKPSGRDSGKATIWIEGEGASPRAVEVGADVVEKIKADLNSILEPEPSE